MNIQTGLSGEYNLVVTHPDGTTTETGWFKNLILDQGLDAIGLQTSAIGYCHIGTGNIAPAVTQVSLASFTAAAARAAYATVTNAGAPTYASSHVVPYTFAQGAVVGNMSEIGVGWANTGNVLFSRALITDANNNPTTLTVTAIDQLTVYYKITFTPNTAVSTGSIVLGGTTYNYSASLSGAASYLNVTNLLLGIRLGEATGGQYHSNWAPGTTTALGPITGAPTGATGNWLYTTPSTAAYIAGNHYLDATYPFTVNDINYASGIGAFLPQMNNVYNYQYVFTPAIPKDNTKTLSLTFRTSWARG